VSRNASAVRGLEPYYLVAEHDWDDMASLQRDFASLAGQATGKDVENLDALFPGIHSMILELEALCVSVGESPLEQVDPWVSDRLL